MVPDIVAVHQRSVEENQILRPLSSNENGRVLKQVFRLDQNQFQTGFEHLNRNVVQNRLYPRGVQTGLEDNPIFIKQERTRNPMNEWIVKDVQTQSASNQNNDWFKPDNPQSNLNPIQNGLTDYDDNGENQFNLRPNFPNSRRNFQRNPANFFQRQKQFQTGFRPNRNFFLNQNTEADITGITGLDSNFGNPQMHRRGHRRQQQQLMRQQLQQQQQQQLQQQPQQLLQQQQQILQQEQVEEIMQQQQQQQQFVQPDSRKQAFNRNNPDGVDFLRRFQNRYQKTDGLFQSDNANLRTPQG